MIAGEIVHFVIWRKCKPAIWISDGKMYVFDEPGAYFMTLTDYEQDAWHTLENCPDAPKSEAVTPLPIVE